MTRYETQVERLVFKLRNSATPVPGFIMGLSGTDSLVAFCMLYEAMGILDKRHRVRGIHYVTLGNNEGRKPDFFEREALPWLRSKYPWANIEIQVPVGGNQDPQRWADLQLRALHEIALDKNGRVRCRVLDPEERFWVSGTTNFTEYELGKYSIFSQAVSIQPLATMRKTQVLVALEELGAPREVIDSAYLPDCFCGREELAATNLEVIDDILDFQANVTMADPVILPQLFDYIRTTKRENGWKSRAPYKV